MDPSAAHSLRVRVGAGRLQPLAWPSVPAGRQSQLRGQRACRPCGGASGSCGAVYRGTVPGGSRLGTSLCGPLPEASRFYLGILAGPRQEQPKRNFWEEILSFEPEFQGNVSPLWASGDPRARGDSYPGTCARQRPALAHSWSGRVLGAAWSWEPSCRWSASWIPPRGLVISL